MPPPAPPPAPPPESPNDEPDAGTGGREEGKDKLEGGKAKPGKTTSDKVPPHTSGTTDLPSSADPSGATITMTISSSSSTTSTTIATTTTIPKPSSIIPSSSSSTTFTTDKPSQTIPPKKPTTTTKPSVVKPSVKPSVVKPTKDTSTKQPVVQPSSNIPSGTTVPPSQSSLPLQPPPLVSTTPFDPLVNYTYIPPTMTLHPNGTSTGMRNGDAMERPLSTLVAPIVGGIAGFGLLAILFFCFTRRRRSRQRPKHVHGRGFDFLQEDDTTVAEEPMSSTAEKHQSGQSYSAIPPRPPPPRPLRFSESFPDVGDPFMDPIAYMHPSDPAEYMHPSDIPEQERPISLYSTHSSIVGGGGGGGHDPDEQPLLLQDSGRALPGYTRLLPPRRDRRRSLQQQLAHSQSSLAWEDTPSVAEVEDMAEIDVSDTQSIQGQNQTQTLPQNQNRLARGKGGGSKRYSPGGMALGRSGSFGHGPIRPSSPLSRKAE